MNADLHALSAAYALDALDADERIEFEAHLATCHECTAEVTSFHEVVAALGDVDAPAVPSSVRASVLGRIGAIAQEPAHVSGSADTVFPRPTVRDSNVVSLTEHRRRRFSVAQLLTAAAVVALIAIGAIVVLGTRGTSEYDQVLSASDAVVTEIAGDAGSLEVVWSPGRDEVAVRGEDFADLDADRRYALWAIADGTPVPAGLFEADGGAFTGVHELGGLDPEAWGVTIEPSTGSPTPTGDVILLGDI